jgi:shikimate dehydrogenase
MISGTTTLIAHLGYPTYTFKSPLIYNRWFEKNGIDAVVVPMGIKAEEYPEFLRCLFKLTNIRGALVTMPHKVTTTRLVDELTPTARIAGAANAVLLRSDGTLVGDQFDGAGFVRGVERSGFRLAGRRALVVGSGGVGSAIAASLAAAGVAALGLFDPVQESSESLAARIDEHYPQIRIGTGSSDPQGYELVVNATPLGMKDNDPLPMDVDRIAPDTFVGEVVLKQQITPFLKAAMDKGCRVQVGTDMLFEQIPACLEFFGFGTTTPEALRATAQIKNVQRLLPAHFRVHAGRREASGSAPRSCRRELMPSLANTLRRCHSTVRGLRNSWVLISEFDSPSRASRAICTSCAVSSPVVWTFRLRTFSPVASSSRRARSANPSIPIADSSS